MNTSKKLSWHAAAIAAALVFSGAANADQRGHGKGDHGNGYGHYHGRQDDRGHHQRAWRDHGRHDYRYYDRGYYHNKQPKYRYYGHPQPRYYGYGNYYYGVSAPVSDFGATLTFQIPLN